MGKAGSSSGTAYVGAKALGPPDVPDRRRTPRCEEKSPKERMWQVKRTFGPEEEA